MLLFVTQVTLLRLLILAYSNAYRIIFSHPDVESSFIAIVEFWVILYSTPEYKSSSFSRIITTSMFLNLPTYG